MLTIFSDIRPGYRFWLQKHLISFNNRDKVMIPKYSAQERRIRISREKN
ncbi:MAG: hypothetical protein ACOWWO_13130 [Peptococcaceae bacterium]